MKRSLWVLVSCVLFSFDGAPSSWIRINLLGYKPTGVKVAVWCSKGQTLPQTFQVMSVEQRAPVGLNGFILLMHIGIDPKRPDKLYNYLGTLIEHKPCVSPLQGLGLCLNVNVGLCPTLLSAVRSGLNAGEHCHSTEIMVLIRSP